MPKDEIKIRSLQDTANLFRKVHFLGFHKVRVLSVSYLHSP